MSKLLPVLLTAAALAVPASPEIVREDVSYELPGGVAATGLLVYDDATPTDGSAAGVLVVPEWWGFTAFPQDVAAGVAETGRVAFVADMYGDRKTTDEAGEAKAWSGAAKETGLAALATAGLEAFAGTGKVDPARLAAIGFCFGGSAVADLVKHRANIAGAASFHGGIGPDAAPAEPGAYPPMVLFHGGADPLVTPAAVAGYTEKAIAAGVPLSVVSFPGAKHAFTNPAADGYGMDATAYDRPAAEGAFRDCRYFLDTLLGERK